MRLINKVGVAAMIAILGGSAHAATIDSFSVSTRNINGANSAVSLSLGTEYTITVSGTFEIDQDRIADAEYFDLQTGSPRDSSGGFDIGLQINEMDIDWGAFSPTSIYSYVTSSIEGIINVRLAEATRGAYQDNVGTLFVEISVPDVVDDPVDSPSEVPLPASGLLLLAGLVGFAGLRRNSA